MLQIENHLYASDLDEAYDTLHSVSGSVVLGGCGYLKLGSRKITTAIDLSKLNLDYIQKSEDFIEIGAMTTLRSLETDTQVTSSWNNVLGCAVRDIVGVQLRNGVTIGGSVAGRYAFSDPLTALMALDAELVFFNRGQMSLESFLEQDKLKDILVKIILPADGRMAAFTSIRKSKTDYAVINCCVSKKDDSFRIVVGSRPGRAMRVREAERYLQQHGLDDLSAKQAGRIAAENLTFGNNQRGSSEYREAVCPVLVERALMEVNHAD
jgi:probable selenate reductase FAD-binding subunit